MRAALGVARYPRGFAEQALLNVFFAADMLRLPFTYNGNITIKDRTPAMWEGIRDDMRIIHYTDVQMLLCLKGLGEREVRCQRSSVSVADVSPESLLRSARRPSCREMSSGDACLRLGASSLVS